MQIYENSVVLYFTYIYNLINYSIIIKLIMSNHTLIIL